MAGSFQQQDRLLALIPVASGQTDCGPLDMGNQAGGAQDLFSKVLACSPASLGPWSHHLLGLSGVLTLGFLS